MRCGSCESCDGRLIFLDEVVHNKYVRNRAELELNLYFEIWYIDLQTRSKLLPVTWNSLQLFDTVRVLSRKVEMDARHSTQSRVRPAGWSWLRMLDTIGVLACGVEMAFSTRHNRGLSPQSGDDILDTIGDLDTIEILARRVETISSTQSEV